MSSQGSPNKRDILLKITLKKIVLLNIALEVNTKLKRETQSTRINIRVKKADSDLVLAELDPDKSNSMKTENLTELPEITAKGKICKRLSKIHSQISQMKRISK